MAPPILPRKKPAPPSDYTAKIAESGLSGLDEARRARRYGVSGVQSALDEGRRPVYATPATSSASSAYDKWLADTAPTYASDQYAYGQTDGPYAGWATIGSMNDAISGRAQILRDQSREMFGALDQMANDNLDRVASDYKDKFGQNWMQAQDKRTGVLDAASAKLDAFDAKEARPPTPAMTDLDGGYKAGVADNAFGGDLVHPENLLGSTVPQAGPTVQRSSNESGVGYSSAGSQPLEQISTDRQSFVDNTLDPWRDREANKWLEQQDFAQQGYATPIQKYGLQAAAEYGVDPNYARGMFSDDGNIKDYVTQRDLDMLESTGMPYDDFMSAANSMLTEQEQQQAASQSASEDQYAQAVNDQVYQDTGGVIGADKLAQQVGLAPADVAAITGSDAFQAYTGEIYDALGSGDPEYVSTTMGDVLRRAAFQDPALLNILQIVYKDYIPTDFSLLDG